MNWRGLKKLLPLLALGAFTVTACSDDDPVQVTAPSAPTNVSVAVNGTTALVTWAPGTGATQQTVTVSDVAGNQADEVQVFQDNTTAAATFENLVQGVTYSVQVTATNSAGSAGSALEVFQIGGGNVVLAPTNVQAVANGLTALDVTWTPGVGGATQRVSLTAPGQPDEIELIANNTTTSTTFTGLTTGIEYTIIVTAIADDATEASAAPITITLSASQVVSGVLSSNQTWSSDVVWILDGPVTVGSDCGPDPANPLGTCDPVTLTIEAGTTVTALRQPSNNAVRSSFLIVARGSQLIADATGANGVKPAEEDVIVFTSDAPRGQRARGDWGGIVLNGRAPINSGDEASGEGDSGFYGGVDDNDSSGILRGVRVEFAGDDVTATDQLNGIALQGTGAGTTLDFVQVHYNQDDGTEPFGGSTSQTHMVTTGIRDDSFDGTDGYRGFIQYAIAQQRADDADNGLELSNNGDDGTLAPISTAVIANATIVGASKGEIGGLGTESDIGLLQREGSGWRIYNTIITNFNDSGFCVEDAVSQARANDAVAGSTTPGDILAFSNSILWANVNRDDDSDVNFADACGGTYANQTFFDHGPFNNLVADPQIPASAFDIGTMMAPPDFTPAAMPGGYTPFDVSTLNNEGGAGIIMPTDGRTLEATNYAGALEPGAVDPWYTGWTVWAVDGSDSRPNADGQ
ncbi:MAG: fibronectin type III domain-containing protein [marine benthic group bacterium]|nr:fibronectin type III domain-containing protein [Gemmatimonadota bacterium]